MILFLWFLVLAAAAAATAGQRTDPFARTVWLDPPVSVADDRALRLDVQTSSILLRAQITKLLVCSAVDQPIIAYDALAPHGTGCDTPGFKVTQVFPLPDDYTAVAAAAAAADDESTHTGASARDHRAPPDMYMVRQRARSMFIKRRLLDPHSPTVWLQATLEVRDERGRIVSDKGQVAMVRFQVPERALAIGKTLPPAVPGQEGPTASLTGKVLDFFGYGFRSEFDGAVDDAMRDYDELDGRKDMGNGTSTRYFHNVHWTSYTGLIFGGLFAVVLLVFAIVRWSRPGGPLRRGRGRGYKSRDHLSDGETPQDDLEAQRANRIRTWTAHAETTGLYHSDFP